VQTNGRRGEEKCNLGKKTPKENAAEALKKETNFWGHRGIYGCETEMHSKWKQKRQYSKYRQEKRMNGHLLGTQGGGMGGKEGPNSDLRTIP